MNKFYSQWGEDALLYEFFKGKTDGFFIDIGAFDGIHLSNSYIFEQIGWKGICVEAQPKSFDVLKINRPGSININKAVIGDSNLSEVDFDVEEIGVLSGINLDINDIKKRCENTKRKFQGLKKIKVKTITLNAIFEKFCKNIEVIDFLSIDIEGMEYNTINDYPFKKFRPRVMIIESNSVKEKNRMNALMKSKGYFFCGYLMQNGYYVSDEKDVAKILKFNKKNPIVCDLEETLNFLNNSITSYQKRKGIRVFLK